MTLTSIGTDADFIERHGLWTEQQQQAAREMIAEADGRQLRNIRVSWADQHGIPRAKAVALPALAGILRRGLTTNVGTLIADSGGLIVSNPFTPGGGFDREEMTGAPDVVAVPDPTTFRILPWADSTGWVLCDLYFTTGEPVPYSSRQALHRAVEAASSMGLDLVTGIEIEWHLTRVETEGGERDLGDMGTPGSATATLPSSFGYQHQIEAELDRLEGILAPIQDSLEALGLPLRTVECEFGPSQLEFTFGPLPALEAADAVLLFRTATKQVCARHGYHASFMSRPGIPGFFSSGWHLHLSACDARSGENVFVSEDPSSILSETGVQFAAGILEHACESTVFTTPTINGYKRFRPNALAPDRVNWGADQRGALLRICGTYGDPATHLENRAGEPAANPYLYVASQIVAGLDGIRRELTPPEQTDRPYETDATLLPASLSAAIEELDNSEFFRDALGSELVDFLLVHKRSEVARWSAAGGVEPTASEESGEEPVSEWEQREYFDLF